MLNYLAGLIALGALVAIGMLFWSARAQSAAIVGARRAPEPLPPDPVPAGPLPTDPPMPDTGVGIPGTVVAVQGGPPANPLQRAQMFAGGAWLGIFLVALLTPFPIDAGYKGTILFCLLVALLAILFYRIIPGPDAVSGGLILLNVGILFFAYADFLVWRLPSPLGLLAAAIAVLVYWRVVRPQARAGLLYKPGMHATGIVYVTLLGFTSWMALEYLVQRPAPWAIAAVVGVLFYWITIFVYHTVNHTPGQAGVAFTDAPSTPPTLPADPTLARRRQFVLPAGCLLLAHWFLALSIWTL